MSRCVYFCPNIEMKMSNIFRASSTVGKEICGSSLALALFKSWLWETCSGWLQLWVRTAASLPESLAWTSRADWRLHGWRRVRAMRVSDLPSSIRSKCYLDVAPTRTPLTTIKDSFSWFNWVVTATFCIRPQTNYFRSIATIQALL